MFPTPSLEIFISLCGFIWTQLGIEIAVYVSGENFAAFFDSLSTLSFTLVEV